MPSVDYQVSADSDDAREGTTGTVVVVAGSNVVVDDLDEFYGFRWQGVTIPVGATITTAWIDLWIINDANDEPNHVIDFEDSSAPAAFTTNANDISGRAGTTATATLSSTNLGVATTGNWISDLQVMPFPEIKTIIQELVDSYDYSSGAAMVARIEGSASNSRDLMIQYFELDNAKAAKLHIEYTAGGAAGTVHPVFANDDIHGIMFGGQVVR